jgi:predicted deacylase
MKDTLFDFDIEDFEVGKGVTRHVDFPSFYGLQKVKAPIHVHRATKEISPCVVVTACVHGDEINGLRIAQSLIKSKLKIKKGTLIIFPVINIYGFLNKQRYLPDRKDLNRCFPGSSNGSFGTRFANFIFKRVTKYGDFYIDLHSGGPGRFNVPQIRCDLNTKGIKEVISCVDIPLIVNSSLRDGSLREAMNEIGKPCIVFEGGEGLRLDEGITKYGVNLVKSVMQNLGMIKAKEKQVCSKTMVKKTKWMRAKEGGILINKTHQGKVVKKDDIVGELRSISGELVSKIKMEHDGVILGMSKAALIMSGDALFNIGFLDDDVKVEEDIFFDSFDLEI